MHRCVFVPVLLLLCFPCTLVYGQTMAELLSQPGWVVEGSPAPVCSQTTCCCFTSVNIYPQANQLYINGTVAGQTCDEPVKRDTLNPPNSFNFTQEFFGMDGVTFNLTNATYNNVIGWSFTATISNCGFTLFRASSTPLPPSPTPVNPNPPVFPDYAQSYLGTWDFDSDTCAVNNASCCCLTGSTTITREPTSNVASYYISGLPSSGCNAPVGSLEQDDFPWPTTGTTYLSTVSVTGFLSKQDNYQITYNKVGDMATLLFIDTTQPVCSMRATQSFRAPDSGSSGLSGGAIFGIVVAVLIGIGVLAYVGRRLYHTYGVNSIANTASPSTRLMPHGQPQEM